MKLRSCPRPGRIPVRKRARGLHEQELELYGFFASFRGTVLSIPVDGELALLSLLAGFFVCVPGRRACGQPITVSCVPGRRGTLTSLTGVASK